MNKDKNTLSEPTKRLLLFMEENNISGYKIHKDIPSISQQQISHIRNGRNDLSIDIATKISNFYNVSLEWLINGNGEKLINNTNNEHEPFLVTKSGIKYYQLANGRYIMRVPFVPIKAYAKYIDEIRDAEYGESLEEYNFIVDQVGHGNYMAFEIKGDSMDDDSRRSLANGDIVLGRELGVEHWKDKLHTNDYPNWIIVLDNTILCKQIIKHDIENCTITCHSLNPSPEYQDFAVNLNDVRKMFNIIQRVSNMM